MPDQDVQLKKGDRVRINAAARAAGLFQGSFGTVVGAARPGQGRPRCVRVLWDNRKTPQTWAAGYLEEVDA